MGNEKPTISKDLQKTQETHQKNRETRMRWKALVEEASDIIFTVDRDTRITYINHPPAGLSVEEAKGTSCIAYVHDKYKKMVESSIADVFRTGKSGEYEICARGAHDIRSWYSTRLNAIKEGNIVKEVLLITRDITKRKKYEKKLKELQEFKSNLLRRTSHELKTPLISIKGYTDFIFDLHSHEISEALKSKLEEIKRGCERLEHLVNELLLAEQLESGKRETKYSPINITNLLHKAIKEVKPLAEKREIQIIKRIPDGRIFVKGEKKDIHEVFSNLLINGIKFTSKSGQITIKLEIKKEHIQISFEDTGIGLTKEEQEKIFKQFGKIEHYGQGYDIISGGSGLGLYISKKIVELHRGTIWVESEGRLKGSTFYVKLPVNEKDYQNGRPSNST